MGYRLNVSNISFRWQVDCQVTVARDSSYRVLSAVGPKDIAKCHPFATLPARLTQLSDSGLSCKWPQKFAFPVAPASQELSRLIFVLVGETTSGPFFVGRSEVNNLFRIGPEETKQTLSVSDSTGVVGELDITIAYKSFNDKALKTGSLDAYEAEVLMSGVMEKRGGPLKVWKQRWFELYPGKLAYFHSNHASQPIKVVSLLTYRALPIHEESFSQGRWAFHLHDVAEREKPYVMAVSTAQSRTAWVEMINLATADGSALAVRKSFFTKYANPVDLESPFEMGSFQKLMNDMLRMEETESKVREAATTQSVQWLKDLKSEIQDKAGELDELLLEASQLYAVCSRDRAPDRSDSSEDETTKPANRLPTYGAKDASRSRSRSPSPKPSNDGTFSKPIRHSRRQVRKKN